ncbi:N-lysine methyltransferase SETD6 [Mantella aurantiaca]
MMGPEGKRRKVRNEVDEPDSTHYQAVSAPQEPDPTHYDAVSAPQEPDSTHYEPVSAPQEPDSTHYEPVSAFLDWCTSHGVQLNEKVCISREGTASQYGMITRRDLAAGEVVFTIPRSALLSQKTTRIRDLLEREGRSLESASGWVPLLLALMYEASDGSSSPWAPYFGLWPQLIPPDLPMFWSEEERAELLGGTGVVEAVRKDLDNLEAEYKMVVLPFILRHPETFSPHTHTLQLYMRLVAFVMAYSFQEPMEDEDDLGSEVPPPMMVPVGDLLNHVSQHNTHLEFSAECLRMVTTRPVESGHELYNTYGEMASWQLLHMYGFCESHPDNINDTADITMTTLRDAALQGAESLEAESRVEEAWSLLCHMDMVGEEGAYVFGRDEILTDEELKTSLKLLAMSAEEFAEYKENDGWEDDDDDDEETLTYQKVACMPWAWRRLLHCGAELAMKGYASSLRSDQLIIEDPAQRAKLTERQKYSLYVRYGQKVILQRVMEATETPPPAGDM